ncbi:unnamed protein product [Phytomonas sp. EM1]|nr:unnamed protein product [Phytomonas sp. EM1]|eukprot:CCW63400.1 unnamed protein product [Phytomonas sp. isolate EM1]
MEDSVRQYAFRLLIFSPISLHSDFFNCNLGRQRRSGKTEWSSGVNRHLNPKYRLTSLLIFLFNLPYKFELQIARV